MTQATVYRFGEVVVDAAGREVRLAGVRVPLEPKPFDVLLILLAEAGRVVDKRRLLREVWSDVHVTDSSLARAITQIRRALGDDTRAARYIETVPTRGYRFVGVLEPPSAPATAAGAVPAAPEAQSHDAVSFDAGAIAATLWLRRRGGLALAAAVVLLTLLAAWGLWRIRTQPPDDVGERVVSAAGREAVQFTTARGVDVDPAWSPDASQVAYATDESGSFEIHVRARLRAASPLALTSNGGDNVSPAWSPDGRWIAFHSRRFGGVWVVPAAGGVPRQVTVEGAAPSWSPDSRSLAIQSAAEPDLLGGTGATPSVIQLVELATGEVRALTNPGRPAGSHGRPLWLPDGEHVVFVSSVVPGGELWGTSRTGTPTYLAPATPTTRAFVFRRDGVTYLGASDTGGRAALWVVPLDGPPRPDRARTTPLPTTVTLADLVVSPDGRAVAYSAAARVSELWSVPMRAGTAEPSGSPAALLHERRPRYGAAAFSPDGRRLAFSTLRAGDTAEAWVQDLASGETTRVTTLEGGGAVKGWTPDGRLQVVEPGRRRVVQAVDLLTGRGEPLVDVSGWPRTPDEAHRIFTLRLAPDGTGRFVYGADTADGLRAVWIGAGPGESEQRLSAPSVNSDFPAWSPDGRRVAYQTSRGWRSTLAVQQVSDGLIRTFDLDADHVWVNDWSPDGTHVVVASMRRGRWSVDVVEVSTGRWRSIVPTGAGGEYVRWPTWSPTGDRIVYERGFWTGNVWIADLD